MSAEIACLFCNKRTFNTYSYCPYCGNDLSDDPCLDISVSKYLKACFEIGIAIIESDGKSVRNQCNKDNIWSIREFLLKIYLYYDSKTKLGYNNNGYCEFTEQQIKDDLTRMNRIYKNVTFYIVKCESNEKNNYKIIDYKLFTDSEFNNKYGNYLKILEINVPFTHKENKLGFNFIMVDDKFMKCIEIIESLQYLSTLSEPNFIDKLNKLLTIEK